MASCQTSDEADSSTEIRVVNPWSLGVHIEPYNTCSLQDGLCIATELFTTRQTESFQKSVEVLRPRMKAYESRDFDATFESPYYPFDEDHFAITSDGLLSVCVRVHDDKNYHQLVTYDHITKEHKKLGRIRRHKFVQDVDASVVCVSDPGYVEGILGALTDDGKYFVVLSHSKGLRMLNVFDIPSTACVLELDCSHVDYLSCGPTGITLNPKAAQKSQYNVAILTEDMGVRLWNTTTYTGRAIRLEDTSSAFYLRRFLINPGQSAIKFSPDGDLLSILGYFTEEHYCACILMDSIRLDIYFILTYNHMYSPLCSLFPCFSAQYSTKLAMFASTENQIMDIDEYKLVFYEIPHRMKSLKKLCKLSILNMVHDNCKLNKLPLSNDLIEYLNDNNQIITALPQGKNQCNTM